MGFARDLKSTALAQAAYSARRRELMVRFRSGRCYRYAGVDEDTAYQMLSADSVGAYVNRHVVPKFASEEISLGEFEQQYQVEMRSRHKGFVLNFPGMEHASFLTLREAA
jgi:hypothetical protein